MLLKNELCVLKNFFYSSFSTFQKTAKPADFLYKPEYQPVTDSISSMRYYNCHIGYCP